MARAAWTEQGTVGQEGRAMLYWALQAEERRQIFILTMMESLVFPKGKRHNMSYVGKICLHTNGQQVYGKVLNITTHQRNANPIQSKVSPHTCQNDYHQKEIISLAKMWREGNPCTLLECKLLQP